MTTGWSDIKRDVLAATDIVEVISAHVQLQRRGKEWVGLCPFHHDTRPSLNVNPEKQIYKCFACGAGGHALTFLTSYHKMEFREALEELAGRAGIALPTGGGRPEQSAQRGRIFEINDWAARFFRANLAAADGRSAAEYLAGRKVAEKTQDLFRIGFAPDSWDGLLRAAKVKGYGGEDLSRAGLVRKTQDGRYVDAFRNRLMFPIEDVMGRVIGFGARRLRQEDQPKYLNTPETAVFQKGRTLYGLRQARSGFGGDQAGIVVEGYMDVLALHQHGFGTAVACLGTALTDEHARLLRRYTPTVVSVFDPDAAGSRAADRALQVCLGQGMEIKVLPLPEGLDPADFLNQRGAEAFGVLLQQAIGALEFKWREISGHLREAEEGPVKRQAVLRFLEVVAQAGGGGVLDEIDQSLLLNRLGSLLGMAPKEVAAAFRRCRQQRGGKPATSVAPKTGAAKRRAEGPAESAQRVLLEVLLNEPALFGRMQQCFDPSVFGDEDMQRLGQEVRDLAESLEEFSFEGDLLPRLQDERVTSLAIALQEQGRRRGNYEGTVEATIERLRANRERQEVGELKRRLVASGSGREDGEQDDLLLRLHARHQARHGAGVEQSRSEATAKTDN